MKWAFVNLIPVLALLEHRGQDAKVACDSTDCST